MPTLRIKLPNQGDVTHELVAERITIGRRPDNTIQIIDRSVSGHHAELIAEAGHYRLHDLGSTNLCFVNGSPVTDFHLHDECRLAFGTIQCEFDPEAGSAEPRLSLPQLEKDLAFLRGENADLTAQITTLRRQIDILGSARLVTKKANDTPVATGSDTFKATASERDDLRHLTTGLKLELEKLREELTITTRERDAARQACELLQAEKVTYSRELRELREQASRGTSPAAAGETSAPAPTSAFVNGESATISTAPVGTPPQATAAQAPAHQIFSVPAHPVAAELPADGGSTQRITLPPIPAFQAIYAPLNALSSALKRLSLNISDKQARALLATQAGKLAQAASALGGHPIVRLGLAIEAMLQECIGKPDCPTSTQIQTLLRATDVVSALLDPRLHDQGKALPHPKVLAVDDDLDLLHSLAASLELAHLSTTTCADSAEAQNLVDKEDYDLLLLDVALPNVNGTTLCNRIRESGRNRKTPVIFLTGANTLDHRAQASLCGGNDFLPKPFHTSELTLKAETWIWKRRFGLV